MMPINLAAARNKLAQAELLCANLRALPGELARDMRRGSSRDYRLPLETYFSACIGAARSCFFVLARTGGEEFKAVSSNWRNATLDELGRAWFNSMLHLRDQDVHYGETGAEAQPKLVELDMSDSSPYVQHNASLLGPPAMAEHVNPDGTTVRAAALQGTVGLYVEILGVRVEAVAACSEFIAQMHSLLRAAEAAEATRIAAVASSLSGSK